MGFGLGKHFDQGRLDRLVDMLEPERRTHIVDVGANPINENPYLDLLKSGHAVVWGFEPNPEAFARLSDTETEKYFPFAIGDGNEGTLHITKAAAFTSLYHPNRTVFKFLGQMGRPSTVLATQRVQTYALDDIDDLPDFDLLKIDVEGGETLVFEGAKDKLSRAVAVISEVAFLPLYEGQPLLDTQMQLMRKAGLDFHKFMGMKNFTIRGPLAMHLSRSHHKDQAVNCDASFMRSLLYPDAMGTEQLKHLTILCDTVLESFAAEVRFLEHLIERGVIREIDAVDYIKMMPHPS